MFRKSLGFSLVELMVAMVVGLIIILGAGQLFLTVFQSGRQVEALGERQAALNFAAEVLLRDARRSFWAASEWDEGTLRLVVPNRGDAVGCEDVYKEYFVVESDAENFLAVRQGCALDELGDAQEIVGGFSDNGFLVEPMPSGATSLAEGYGALIRFFLSSRHLANDDVIEFYAINRTASVQGATISGDPSGGGSGGGGGENGGDENGSDENGDGSGGDGAGSGDGGSEDQPIPDETEDCTTTLNITRQNENWTLTSPSGCPWLGNRYECLITLGQGEAVIVVAASGPGSNSYEREHVANCGQVDIHLR